MQRGNDVQATLMRDTESLGRRWGKAQGLLRVMVRKGKVERLREFGIFLVRVVRYKKKKRYSKKKKINKRQVNEN